MRLSDSGLVNPPKVSLLSIIKILAKYDPSFGIRINYSNGMLIDGVKATF